MKNMFKIFEKVIVVVLIGLMMVAVLVSTLKLAVILFRQVKREWSKFMLSAKFFAERLRRYGRRTPIKDAAKAFLMLEAVTGQIYLVVLVARLVGINIAQSMNKKV